MDAAQVVREQELYVWDYCNPSLRISSRLALSCLSNDDVYTVLYKYEDGVDDLSPNVAPLADFMRYDYLPKLSTRY